MQPASLAPLEYYQVGVNSPQCCTLMSASGHRTHRVVAGDNNGMLACFGIKKGQAVPLFETPTGLKLSKVTVSNERVFVAAGSQVCGFSRKGKLFFDFTVPIPSSIVAMAVHEEHLHVASEFAYKHFVDCKETNSVTVNERISALALVYENGRSFPTPVLACADQHIRIIEGSDIRASVLLPGRPTVLCAFGTPADGDALVLFGTSCGKFGLVNVSSGRVAACDMNEDDSAGITSVAELLLPGLGEAIAVGRNDGLVQVFDLSEGTPSLSHQASLSGAVTSLAFGPVSSATEPELVASTYSGSIFGLPLSAPDPVDLDTRLAQLKAEVAQLESQVTAAAHAPAVPTMVLAELTLPEIEIVDSMTLLPDEASYLLSIELASSIDTLVLRADVPVDVLDSREASLSVSFTPCAPNETSLLLATYTCQPGVTRLQIKLRTIEGTHGAIHAFIIPATTPKVAYQRTYPIHALSLHRPASAFDPSTLPLNTLEFTGKFSLMDMHTWLARCLPSLPDKPTADGCHCFYESSFINTHLECHYRAEWARLRTENLCTLSIVRDVVTQAATARNCAISFSTDVNDDSVPHALSLLIPKLQEQNLIVRKLAILPALQDLVSSDGGEEFLPPDYREILSQASELQADSKRRPFQLERLYGIITDMYIDKFKFQGVNAKGRIPALMQMLESCNGQDIVDFFNA
eukprot:m.111900 g.111900  ORF g.111900 m.111900 type:complete len:691 (-) comp14362_c1_seq1:24-2096(-)